MRRLPTKPTDNQKIIIEACRDFYNKSNKSARKLALFLMGRKARLEPLTEDERGALFCVKKNLSDKIYRDNIKKDVL